MPNSDIDFVMTHDIYLLPRYHLTIAVHLPLKTFRSKIIARRWLHRLTIHQEPIDSDLHRSVPIPTHSARHFLTLQPKSASLFYTHVSGDCEISNSSAVAYMNQSEVSDSLILHICILTPTGGDARRSGSFISSRFDGQCSHTST
jgi:hypothetical protein